MNEEYIVEQRTGNKSTGANIGVQKIYNGTPPEKAAEIASNLFLNNYPKLEAKAIEVVKQRVDEFLKQLFSELNGNSIDYSVFQDPDMQFVLYKAEESYARFGSEELLDRLCMLIKQRIEYDSKDYYKMLINTSLRVTPQLSSTQVNYLTAMFLLKRIKRAGINSIEQLESFFQSIVNHYGPVKLQGFSLLRYLGCFDFYFGDIEDILAQKYHLNKEDIKKIMPAEFDSLSGDYMVSDVGTVIAITNINIKEKTKIELERYIRE